MQRIVIGTLLSIGFLAALVYMTLAETNVRCEVCIAYQGKQTCEAATAPDRDQAQMQATTSACSRIAGGVTDSIRCSSAAPLSLRCDDGGS